MVKNIVKLWFVVQLLAFVVYGVGALSMTGISFGRMAWGPNGNPRLYVALKMGDQVWTEQIGGAPYLMTGAAMVEVVKTLDVNSGYRTNPTTGRRDFGVYHRICMRSGASPLDVAAFVENRNCMWLRDNDTNPRWDVVAGIKALKAIWEIVEEDKRRFCSGSCNPLPFPEVEFEPQPVPVLPIWLAFLPTILVGVVVILSILNRLCGGRSPAMGTS